MNQINGFSVFEQLHVTILLLPPMSSSVIPLLSPCRLLPNTRFSVLPMDPVASLCWLPSSTTSLPGYRLQHRQSVLLCHCSLLLSFLGHQPKYILEIFSSCLLFTLV